MTSLFGNKAKTARRVVEVLEFFDEQNRHVTVMDIVRRYNRPQSSTSELLASLVDLGLLYKDSSSRSYTLTPRAALLGSQSQPSLVRDGSLSMLIDRLEAQTNLSTAVMGMVRVNAQVFRWSTGTKHTPEDRGLLGGGAQERLSDSAAGWLLLSTVAPNCCERIVRRLNAEAPPERKFSAASLTQRIQESGRQGYTVGPAGFGCSGEMVSVLLPAPAGESPMVLGFVYQPSDAINPAKLVELLQSSVQRCLRPAREEYSIPEFVSNAA